uniref:hypothetical protein n=1 Tax=Herbidospora sakaeratensis TaxID=564415 RepID=UPI0007833507|nr:hypothetical protein [Herbidospora sakaeratensis]
MRVPNIRHGRKFAVLLCTSFLLAACFEAVAPVVRRVDPYAVEDIREIGKVVGETTDWALWDSTTEISNVLVIDVGRPGPKGAVGTARRLLQERGWTHVIDRHPTIESMTSTRWPDIGLSIEGIEYHASHPGLNPDAEKLLKDAIAQTGSTGVVLLEAQRIDL